MITLRAFILVVSVIALRHAALNGQFLSVADKESQWHEPQTIYPDTLIAACVLCCVVSKFLAVFAALHADVAGQAVAWRRFTQQRVGLVWFWTLVQAPAFAFSNLADWLVSMELAGKPASCMILAWFLPSAIVLGVLEYCTVELERDMSARTERSSYRMWWERVRLDISGQVLTCLIPVVIILGANDLLETAMPQMAPWLRLLLAVTTLGLLCISVAPLWMRWIMPGQIAAGDHPLKQRVDEMCASMKLPCPQLLVVGAGGNWYGAAAVGWLPLFRQLWIGAALPQALSPAQIDMVLLHELAHIQRGHCWWRTLPLFVAAPLILIATAISSPVTSLPWIQPGWVLLLAAFLAWLLGWISRRCELDADRVACQQASRICLWTDGRPERAAKELSQALLRLQDPQQSASARHWLHPSLKARIELLTTP